MVDWLEQKARASLDRVLDEQRDGIWKLNAKASGAVSIWLLRGGRMHGNQGDEGIEGERMCSTQSINQQLLNAKTEVKSIDLDSAQSIDFLFNGHV
ncbi:hypothetical protein OsI_37999 [Oryza sativa Indica Group]|uniref:Uncharacterized protein n=1 Tax=Oryza sativa subsp. indica TaxID=39946 RepID=A2ZJK9_ORYSI|nr:hypothetical protein OsI_37999 [Oryza sativa Indica Group]